MEMQRAEIVESCFEGGDEVPGLGEWLVVK